MGGGRWGGRAGHEHHSTAQPVARPGHRAALLLGWVGEGMPDGLDARRDLPVVSAPTAHRTRSSLEAPSGTISIGPETAPPRADLRGCLFRRCLLQGYPLRAASLDGAALVIASLGPVLFEVASFEVARFEVDSLDGSQSAQYLEAAFFEACGWESGLTTKISEKLLCQ